MIRRIGGWLCAESWAILLICTADLLTTLVFLRQDMASEGNPLMNFYLGYGIGAFVLVKAVLVLAPLTIIEWGRRTRPDSVRRLARLAIFGYIGIYTFLFMRVNMPTLVATPTASLPPMVGKWDGYPGYPGYPGHPGYSRMKELFKVKWTPKGVLLIPNDSKTLIPKNSKALREIRKSQ